jgi:hypothetical protein
MVHNAFHHEHTHGRAFHGLEARDMLQVEKRDSHGDKIKLNVPDNKLHFIHNKPQAANNQGKVVETVYSQVYVTESPTFGGPVAGYTTATGPDPPKGSPLQGGHNAAEKSRQAAQEASYLSAKSLAHAPNTAQPSSTSLNTKPTQRTRTTAQKGTPAQHTRETPFSSTSLQNNAVVGSPQTHTRDPTNVAGTPISASRGPDTVISEKSDGMSSGAKAGLAFGIIIAIALAAGLVFFCWRRRKQQLNKGGNEAFDEKRGTKDSFFGGTTAAATRGPQRESIQSEKSFTSTRTAATAPRLSLRPVTQFLPNILTGEKSNTNGNTLDVPAMSEKPRSNPFDDSAAARPVSPGNNPFEDGDGAVVAAGKTTPGHSQQNSWEGSEPPTPKSAKFGTAAAVPISSQAPRGPNNVHRVQLDFKPSMEDELELRSGQLVRMLHEYDDGWVSQSKPSLTVSSANITAGPLHPPRSLSTRCLPAYLPV